MEAPEGWEEAAMEEGRVVTVMVEGSVAVVTQEEKVVVVMMREGWEVAGVMEACFEAMATG